MAQMNFTQFNNLVRCVDEDYIRRVSELKNTPCCKCSHAFHLHYPSTAYLQCISYKCKCTGFINEHSSFDAT
jgi:hypothetical protein